MLKLRTRLPEFALPDVVTGATVTSDQFSGKKALAVMFICNHCPYVQHAKQGIAQIIRDYTSRGVGFVAISSNDADRYPEDRPEKVKEMVQAAGIDCPVLFDQTQEVAKAFAAACTPDFYLFDNEMKLSYRGQFDGSRPGSDEPVTGGALRSAIDRVLDHQGLTATALMIEGQTPSVGCSIKWKPGNEPGYFQSAVRQGE